MIHILNNNNEKNNQHIQEGLNVGAGNVGHQEDGLGYDTMICPSRIGIITKGTVRHRVEAWPDGCAYTQTHSHQIK